MRLSFQRLAQIFFWLYLALFPGSTALVALDRVPSWGTGMGGALLLLQGMATLCWLLGHYGARGGRAALSIFVLAWGLEYIGVITGMPFGRYRYTGALQPQLFGIVPLAIPCAWLMVAAGAWQLATTGNHRPSTNGRRLLVAVGGRWSVVVAATLVLMLDLQIETVATRINQYWIWLDGGPYYGVPAANFVAWWLAGLAIACLIAILLPELGKRESTRRGAARRGRSASHLASRVSRLVSHLSSLLPAYLYLLSTLMFAIVNLARGYTIAGLVGAIVLLGAGLAARPAGARGRFRRAVEPAERAD